MSEFKSSIGTEASGGGIDWSFDKKRIDDPVITALMQESTNLFINNTINETSNREDNLLLKNYVTTFHDVLSENSLLKGMKSKKKFLFSYTLPTIDLLTSTGKGKIKKPTKAELIISQNKEKKNLETMTKFSKTLVINRHYPLENKNYIESFFSIIYWAIYLLSNKKDEIPLDIFFDCAISLYRAIEDSRIFLTSEMINESYELLNTLEIIIRENPVSSGFSILLDNSGIILESHWDKIKPKSISLYDEQKDIISLIQNNLDKSMMVFYESPPANGKTLVSVIIAKVIAHQNKVNIKSNPKFKRKILLYICYNSIVRSEVGRWCVTHNVDVKNWIAITKADGKDDGKIKTLLRPHKSCYPDWNRKNARNSKEEAIFQKAREDRFSDELINQMLFFLEETLSISRQRFGSYLEFKEESIEIRKKSLDDPSLNYPEMIISDLESAYQLLKEFPDMFVTYFDEAFAAADLEITAKIFSVLNGPSILVSATLAKPEEIPNVIDHFRKNNNLEGDNFMHTIKSTIQNISCNFVDQNGYMLAPHQKLDNIRDLTNFLDVSFHEPLIKRSYSPDIVFNMSKLINSYLPSDLKFERVFNYYGKLTHSSIRDYAYNILSFILSENKVELFDLLKSSNILIINDMNVNTLLTSSAVYYQTGKFLHVSTSENFDNHVEDIAREFLDKSPRISDILNSYDNKIKAINKSLESIKKGEATDAKDIQYREHELNKNLDEIKLDWPSEFLMNSRDHAKKFGNSALLKHPNNITFANRSDFGILSDTEEKLLFSGIGIYNPQSFNKEMMDLFLTKKDHLKGILSTPSIVYGTNIPGLSKIDIDKSFVIDSTKNILYQLIGRAGRRGKSDSAIVIFRDDEMLNIILNQNNINVEANKVRLNFDKLFST
jgi:hypothetical protein